MLNSKSLYHYNEALDLIINSSPTTLHIKTGEEILKRLRRQQDYLLLTTQYLNCATISLLNDQKKLFTLLQIRKNITPNCDIVWWHLVQFYFTCNKKMSQIIIEIVKTELKTYLKSEQLKNSCTNINKFFQLPLTTNCCGFSHLTKLLNLSFNILEILLRQFKNSFQTQVQKQKWMTQCKVISEFTTKFFERFNSMNPMFTQNMITIALSTAAMIDSVQGSSSLPMTNHFLRFSTEFDFIGSVTPFSRLICLESSSLMKQTMENAICDLLTESQNMSENLAEQKFQLKNTLLLKKLQQNDSRLMVENLTQIIFIYYNFIMSKCQAGPSAWETLLHEIQSFDPIFARAINFQASQNDIKQSKEPIHRFSLLSQCLTLGYLNIRDILIMQQEMAVIVVASFAATHFEAWNQSCPIITSFVQNSLKNENKPNTESILFCCLIFIWRFLSKNPTLPGFLHLCNLLIDVRLKFKNLQLYIDQILVSFVPLILTYYETPDVWSFSNHLIDSIQGNEFDRSAQSYAAIILLMENSHGLNDSTEQSKIVKIFTNLMQHLIEEEDTNEVAHFSQFSNFDLFYKLAACIINYISFFENQEMEESQNKFQLLNVLSQAQKYLFKNSLHSCETGVLYAYYLTLDSRHHQIGYGILRSMKDFEFWRSLDIEDCLFYGGICMRLSRGLLGQDGSYLQRIEKMVTSVMRNWFERESEERKEQGDEKIFNVIHDYKHKLGFGQHETSQFWNFLAEIEKQ